MRIAVAVRRAEPAKRNGGSGHFADAPRPEVLAVPCVEAVVHAADDHMGAQVIDVPVRTSAGPEMMRHPRAHSSRAKRAADVDVEARLNRQVAQLPDTDSPALG